MAKLKETFQQMVARGVGYAIDQNHVAGDRRMIHLNGWTIHESGMIEFSAHGMARDPVMRERVAQVMGVEIDLAKNYQCKFMTADGEVFPKAWLRDNPVLLWDREYNKVFAIPKYIWDYRLYYPHPMAAPVCDVSAGGRGYSKGICIYKPDPQRVKLLMKDERIMTPYKLARAEFRLENRGAYITDNRASNEVQAWLQDPSRPVSEIVHNWLGGKYEKEFRESISEFCVTEKFVPYIRVAN